MVSHSTGDSGINNRVELENVNTRKKITLTIEPSATAGSAKDWHMYVVNWLGITEFIRRDTSCVSFSFTLELIVGPKNLTTVACLVEP